LNGRISRVIVVAGILFVALCLPLGLDPQGYAIRVLTLIFLFAAMAQSWNIVGGLANQMSLGHAAFFGIGAYTSTVLLIRMGLSPWLGMCAAALLGGMAAALLSLPTMRLSGHYFALATLAFGEVMRVIANTWASVTGGPGGISVPFGQDSWWMLNFKSTRPHYYLTLGALVIIPLEEAANFAFSAHAAGLSALVYGLLLVTIIFVEPRGLVALAGLQKRWRRGS